ncbi:hypothetical protein [Kutzneria sp. NPDC052558]|uniref:hypothetical protein n=1 Tax=Kutzneria sp. NPDC052558 TaxID=3364121 RepID=UPI0037C64D2D
MGESGLAGWTVADSRRRGVKRWGRFPADVLDLTVAEMDLPVAEPIMAALRDSVERQAFAAMFVARRPTVEVPMATGRD